MRSLQVLTPFSTGNNDEKYFSEDISIYCDIDFRKHAYKDFQVARKTSKDVN